LFVLGGGGEGEERAQSNNKFQARKRGTPVPETVIDQIRLWESERNRVSFQKGFLYDSFANEQMYRETVQYAKDLSIYLYSNDEKRYLMADDSGHERMKAFLKKKYG
jgi:transcription initiation factor TFIIH subunit 4